MTWDYWKKQQDNINI